MRTFIDDNRVYGSTFLLYGNINDDYYCPDATVKKMDQYLVSLLKARGYRHVIFYGTGGTRGAYCLDAVSARFFFNANRSLPPAGEADQGSTPGAAAGQTPPPSSGGSVADRLRSGKNKRKARYTPGSLSSGAENPPTTLETPETPASAAPAESAPPARVQYALRKMTVGAFYSQYRDKLLDRNSNMAIVFYNVLTDYGSQESIFLQSLKDDILMNFTQVGDHNLCLIVAPDTMESTYDLQNLIRSNGLGGKFLINRGNNECVFKSECCFHLGFPGKDEIKNMLHRFALVGTSRHKRIRFDYGQIDELAEHILANSSVAAQREDRSKLRQMRVIAYKMEEYIHSHAKGNKRIEITKTVIDEIWNVHTDPQEAMKKLERRGWETVRHELKRAIRSCKESFVGTDEESDTQPHQADIGMDRFAVQTAANDGPRPSIPNFVLLGNPGTGKTTIARLIGQVLYAEGLLKVGHFRETNLEKLTNSYHAGIPKETMARVDEAEEGVLFIDEAHALGRKDGGVNSDGSGVQIVSTLNAAMTDPNRHFCTILAGYANEMDAVFELDPGFRSRFTAVINIDDYDPELLYEILLEKIRDTRCRIDPALIEEKATEDNMPYIPLRAMVDRIYSERNRKRFGNARDMDTLAKYAAGAIDDSRTITQACFYGAQEGKVTEEYFTPMNLGMTKEKIFKTMDEEYVGMTEVRKMLEATAVAIERILSKGQTPDDVPLDAIMLVGNPGTGKTVVANMLAKLYYYYGILGTPEAIVCNASDLVSANPYDTTKVTKQIAYAQDRKAFLFVDEAHNLNAEALKAFMAPVTDRKKPFIACFAVYCDEKERFLALDLGSRSRLEKKMIHLRDYEPDELYEILTRAMVKRGFSADERTHAMLKQLARREYDTRTTQTGNARHILNILDLMETELNLRCKRQGIALNAPEAYRFTETDIPEKYRKGLSAGDNKSRLEELKTMDHEIRNHRVGNAELKDVMLRLLKQLRNQLRFPDATAKHIEPGHYFFKGNPGTGKTSSLKYLGDFLFRMGIIKDPEPVPLSASRLVGQYLGQTAVQTRTLLEQNMGRLILIDEAYALSDPNDHANSYKRDAITELVAKLDDPVFRKTTCVVFAGYPGDMDGLYRVNPGMSSRVKEVSFPDFTKEECIQILRSMLEDHKAPIDDGTLALCDEQIDYIIRSRNFANGRSIRLYAELLVSKRNDRLYDATDEEALQPGFTNILPADIPQINQVVRQLNL